MDVDYEYRIFGLRRSGNHAISSWIISSMPDNSVYYFNDVYYDFPHLYNSIITSSLDEYAGNISNKLKYNAQWNENKKCLISSYEDQPLSIIPEINKQQNGNVKFICNVFIIRDIKNLIASRLELARQGNKYVGVGPEFFDVYLQYYKLYKFFLTDPTSFAALFPNQTSVFILYNKWNSDESYRQHIAQLLHIDNIPDGHPPNINSRMFYGGGSSFKTDTPLSNSLSFNNRWHKYINDPEYKYYIELFSELLKKNKL